MYPIDLPDVDYTDLNLASEQYMASLESRSREENEWFQTSHSKVEIMESNTRRLQLFGDDQPDCGLLALHHPDDLTQVLALYLHGKWWSIDDILRTSSKSRNGLVLVQSVMERVILFLLNQFVEKCPEGETLFRPHTRTEHGKLLWKDGEAVGFYTVKQKVISLPELLNMDKDGLGEEGRCGEGRHRGTELELYNPFSSK